MQVTKQLPGCTTHKKPLVTILTKPDHYHAAVLQGFFDEHINLAQAEHIDVTVIMVEQYDFVSVGAKAQAALNTMPNMIVTIGLLCTQAVMHILDTQKNQTPLVFCGVAHLQDAGLDTLLTSQNSMITGVSLGYPSYRTIARALLWMKPHVKSVLLPYSPIREGGMLTNAALLIKEFLSTHHVTTNVLPLAQGADMMQNIKEKIGTADALLSLEGCVVDDHYQELVTLCNTNAITYFSSSLAAVRAGAAIGLVHKPTLVGTYAFRKCLSTIKNEYMHDKGKILLLKNEGRRMAFNFDACHQQGIILSPEKLYLLKNLDVFGSFYQLIDNEE